MQFHQILNPPPIRVYLAWDRTRHGNHPLEANPPPNQVFHISHKKKMVVWYRSKNVLYPTKHVNIIMDCVAKVPPLTALQEPLIAAIPG